MERNDQRAARTIDEVFDMVAYIVGGKVIRPATGYLGPNGMVRGRMRRRGARRMAASSAPSSS